MHHDKSGGECSPWWLELNELKLIDSLRFPMQVVELGNTCSAKWRVCYHVHVDMRETSTAFYDGIRGAQGEDEEWNAQRELSSLSPYLHWISTDKTNCSASKQQLFLCENEVLESNIA